MPQELSQEQARQFYNRFGAKQDAQGFYEDGATEDMLKHADFEAAAQIFEFGCGTGRFAQTLLSQKLSPEAQYTGIDLSSTMVQLATERLRPWQERAKVTVSDGSQRIDQADNSYDRFVSNFVFDLLPPDYARAIISEAYRLLASNGRLCLVSLTEGNTPASRLISWGWERVFRIRPQLVGGCHPVKLLDYLPSNQWAIYYHHIVRSYAIPSEIVIAVPLK